MYSSKKRAESAIQVPLVRRQRQSYGSVLVYKWVFGVIGRAPMCFVMIAPDHLCVSQLKLIFRRIRVSTRKIIPCVQTFA
jgi:hypothetical protein